MSDNKNDEVLDDILNDNTDDGNQPLEEAAKLLAEAAERDHHVNDEDDTDPDAPKEFDLYAEDEYTDEQFLRRSSYNVPRRRKRKSRGAVYRAYSYLLH